MASPVCGSGGVCVGGGAAAAQLDRQRRFCQPEKYDANIPPKVKYSLTLNSFYVCVCVCVQVSSAAPSARAGGTTSHARSARSASARASQRSGSVTGTTTAATTATRTDAVSRPCFPLVFFKLSQPSHLCFIFMYFFVRPTAARWFPCCFNSPAALKKSPDL